MQLTPATFDELRSAIHRLCGLVISDDREYLIRDRLGPVMRQRGVKSFEDLSQRLRARTDERLVEAVIEGVMTGETSFFRDPHVFQALATEVFPRIAAEQKGSLRPVRIWSAGVSTGQEAYSLAMLAQEFVSQHRGKVRGDQFSILASDISSTSLQTAEAGCYAEREVARGVSAFRVGQFFRRVEKQYHVVPEIKQRIEFRKVNLCGPLAGLGTFDLICCRNVMIYFDVRMRQQICSQFQDLLRPHGWLLLGGAENLYGISTEFESVRLGDAILYRKLGSASPRACPDGQL